MKVWISIPSDLKFEPKVKEKLDSMSLNWLNLKDDGELYLGLNYLKDRSKIEYILGNVPDKFLKIFTEKSKVLDYPCSQFQGQCFYQIPISLARRGALKKLATSELTHDRVDVETLKIVEGSNPKLTLKQAVDLGQKLGWFKGTQVSGEKVYLEPYLLLLETFRNLYRANVCKYPTCRLPHLTSNHALIQTNIFKNLFTEIYYPFIFNERDKGKFQSLANTVLLKEGLATEDLKSNTNPLGFHLTHNCCLSFYWTIKDKDLKQMVKISDLDATSYRNEGGAANGRERYQAFRRIQSIVVGAAQEVETEISNLQERIPSFLKLLGFSFKVLKLGAWYGPEGSEGLNSKISEPYTIDYQVKTKSGLQVEVMNLTRARTHFTKAYEIKSKKELAHSGCSGMGLERLASVFLAQHGYETEFWPLEVRNEYNRLSKL